ncbi:hypothetical protein EDD22DRAFT_1027062 [Suillus occidentalis]|nr:hypothetical protein EDD22DRAFT_1027062 [Suillus occidentalis]
MNVQQENLDLVKERDHYRAKCATANTQLASMENTIEDLKTQLNDSKRYVLQLQNGNERQHETRATTTNISAATLARDIEVLTTNLNDSKRHVTQLQDGNERLASLNAAMKHDAESLRTQLNESKWNVVQLQKDNEQLQNQASVIIALERDTDKLKKQLNESKQHAAQLQNDNKQLQKEASEATAMKRQLNDAKHRLLDGVFHNHRPQQESRIVREATPVTPAPSKLSASSGYPGRNQSVSNGASVPKLKRKRSVSEEDDSSRQSIESDSHQITPELPATLMWRFQQEGLELSPDTILKNVRDCSRVISSPLSIPVPFDFISRLDIPFLAFLDLRLGGYVPAGPGQQASS